MKIDFFTLRSRTFIKLYHSRPNEDADCGENGGERHDCKGDDPSVTRRGYKVFKWVEKAKSEGNNKGKKPLNELRIYLHRVLGVAREVIDKL